MVEDTTCFKPPSIGSLRWLADPGSHVPGAIYSKLLSRLFSGSAVIIMGVVNSVLLSSVALAMNSNAVFGAYILLDLAFGILRVLVIRAVARAMSNGAAPPVDIYLAAGVLWCGLQGAIGFTAMQSGNVALEVLAAVQIFGIIGPICARNYPSPRYAMLLVGLCDLPFVAGCVLSGNHWLLITIPETPIFLYGAYKVVETFQKLAVQSLTAELESQHRATHDPLTGLLNRRGLTDTLNHRAEQDTARLAVLALDLDGFKKVNDTLGHHMGDALLKAVADRLVARVRPCDSVIRLGGDEFVIIATGLSPLDVARLCDRIIGDIGAAPYLLEDEQSVSVGVSVGFACAPEDGVAVDMLHRRADAALYVAKASGKGVCRRYVPFSEHSVETIAETAYVTLPCPDTQVAFSI